MTHLIYEPSGMDKSPYPHENFAAKALSRIKYELGKANKIKRLLVVLKNGKVITLK